MPRSRRWIGGVIKPRAWRHAPGSTTRSGFGCRQCWPRSLDEGARAQTTAASSRRFFEAVVWWRRTGVPWRDLPDEFGPWQTVFNRFDRWSKNGRWAALFAALVTDIDSEWQSIDSTTNRAHQHAAGGKGGLPPTASADLGAGRPPRFT
jgi:transposase